MVDISFETVVKDITEGESQELIDRLIAEDVISEGEIEHGLTYDGMNFALTHSEIEPPDETHRLPEDWGETQILIIEFRWYREGDTEGGKFTPASGDVDVLINRLQHLTDLRDEIQAVTDKEVVTIPHEYFPYI